MATDVHLQPPGHATHPACATQSAELAASSHPCTIRAGAINPSSTNPAPLIISPPSPGAAAQNLFAHIQHLLDDKTILFAETGDSIFNCQKLKLPTGCR